MAVARQEDTVFVANLQLQNVHGGEKRKIGWNSRLPETGSNEKEMDDEMNGSFEKVATSIDTSFPYCNLGYKSTLVFCLFA